MALLQALPAVTNLWPGIFQLTKKRLDRIDLLLSLTVYLPLLPRREGLLLLLVRKRQWTRLPRSLSVLAISIQQPAARELIFPVQDWPELIV
jgi:hypothetical protein